MLRQRHTELGIVQLNAVDIGVKVTGGIGNGRFQRIRPVRDNVDFIRAQPLSHPDPTPDYLQCGLLDAFFPLRQPVTSDAYKINSDTSMPLSDTCFASARTRSGV